MPSPAALSYPVPFNIAGRMARNYAWLVSALLIPVAILTTSFFFIVPRFKEVFRDFRTALPAFTEVMLRITSFIVDYWIISIPLILLLTAVVPVLPTWYASVAPDERSQRRRRRLFFWLTLLLSLLMTAIIVVALFLPLIKLIQSVSGGEQDRG